MTAEEKEAFELVAGDIGIDVLLESFEEFEADLEQLKTTMASKLKQPNEATLASIKASTDFLQSIYTKSPEKPPKRQTRKPSSEERKISLKKKILSKNRKNI